MLCTGIFIFLFFCLDSCPRGLWGPFVERLGLGRCAKTFLDWLIIFDCILCLFNLRTVILLLNYLNFDAAFCVFHVFCSFFTTLCNRLLSLGIVLYRFTLVLGSSFVFSSNQKKVLENIILLAILLPSLKLTGWAIYYREDSSYYLGKVKN